MTDQTNVSIQNLFNKNPLEETSKAQAQEEGAWMSVQEASNATGLSMGTLRRYVKARKLKSRRQGRSINSKLQVWISPDFLPDDSGQSEIVEFDDEQEATLEEQEEEILDFRGRDQADQSIDSTLTWMREKLDERDAQLREKEAKIEALSQQLAGATYRNGYLEAEKKNFEQQLLLLEDKSRQVNVVPEPTQAKKSGTWVRFGRWLAGK